MFRKLWVSVLLALLLALVAGAIYAQDSSDPRGSIRGTVYEDLNADGRCVGTGEPALAGVTIQFVSNDGDATVYLYSGTNGTYGLVAAGLGSWTVTAQPPAGYVVTSKNPLQVFLGVEEEKQLVLGADFCVFKGTAVAVPPIYIPPGSVTPPIFLPESGARVAPAVSAFMLLGAGMVVSGLALEWRRRSNNGKN